MARRRPDKQRIYEARRAAQRNRLVSEGMAEERAELWIAAWEAASPSSELERLTAAFWLEGANWIRDQRRTRREP